MGATIHRVDGELEHAQRTESSEKCKDEPDQCPSSSDARITSTRAGSGRDED
jgi:hypothetical protein